MERKDRVIFKRKAVVLVNNYWVDDLDVRDAQRMNHPN